MHEALVAQLQAEAVELKEERKLLWDRLGAIGLGGPLFHIPPPEVQAAAQEEDAQAAELAYIQSLSRTPSKLAAYYTKKAFRDAQSRFEPPSVARLPDLSKINERLDNAEAEGKKQA